MADHCWGDSWPHWKELYEAESFIWDYTKKWSRCCLISKEKYGTIRYEHMVPPKGHVVCLRYAIKAPWTKTTIWETAAGTRSFTYRPTLWAWNQCWLYRKWMQFGWYICGKAIKKAIKRWPYLEEELCCDFMAPTKFGRECEKKYWVTIGGNQ